jgi:hypothetical protein
MPELGVPEGDGRAARSRWACQGDGRARAMDVPGSGADMKL